VLFDGQSLQVVVASHTQGCDLRALGARQVLGHLRAGGARVLDVRVEQRAQHVAHDTAQQGGDGDEGGVAVVAVEKDAEGKDGEKDDEAHRVAREEDDAGHVAREEGEAEHGALGRAYVRGPKNGLVPTKLESSDCPKFKRRTGQHVWT
jgi:hypothetical protein